MEYIGIMKKMIWGIYWEHIELQLLGLYPPLFPGKSQ